MSLMNGVDSEEIIAEKVGVEHLLPAVIKVVSHIRKKMAIILILRQQSELFWRTYCTYDSDRIRAIEELFKGLPESISGRQSMQEKRCGASFGFE